MLELQNISYSVRENGVEKNILKNISLIINDHQNVVITGQNGSGKSTLAKIIMGIIQPTSGKIIFNGEDITHLSVTERAQKGIAFGFQQPVTFKGLKVRDLLEIILPQNTNCHECCTYLAKVGLCAKDYLERPLDNKLSGGELKRIEIATILARPGGLLIFLTFLTNPKPALTCGVLTTWSTFFNSNKRPTLSSATNTKLSRLRIQWSC